MVGAVFIVGIPAYADKFTSAQVLEWPKESQDNYFLASITMAGVVAAQNPGGKAKCVDEWYLQNEDITAKRNAYIRSVMGKYPDHHPAGIMIAVIEKACGSFEFGN